jgi:hypothetical protein
MLQQTLYPLSGRTPIEVLFMGGTFTWPTTQIADLAGRPPQSDATFDQATYTPGDIGLACSGVTWTLDSCTYTDPIHLVKVRTRNKQVNCLHAQTSIEPLVGAIPVGGAYGHLFIGSVPLLTTTRWYDFDFYLNPRTGLVWNATDINALSWGWFAFMANEDYSNPLHAYGYEFEVEIHSQDEASSLISRI